MNLPHFTFTQRTRLLLKTAVLAVVLWKAGAADGQNSQFTYDASGGLVSQASQSAGVPKIVGQPRAQIVIPGESASFNVVVANPGGASYQWYFAAAPISGATSDALLITGVASTNEGPYQVTISNGSGAVTSSVASLYLDANGNGLPDSWELEYFGNFNQTAQGDADGDGVSNLQEFLDGTNPTNAVSALYRISLVNDGGTIVMTPSLTAYTNGQSVTLTAIASGSYPFHAWTGDIVSRSNPLTVTMTNNLSLFAHFQPFLLHWTNSAGGDWNVAANWLPNLVPGSNENVEIAASTALLNGALVTENSNVDLVDFSFGRPNVGPELTGAGRVTIAGIGTWCAGTMSGSGSTVVLPGGSLNISNLGPTAIFNRTLENAGAVSWIGGNMQMGAGIITNDAGARFQLLNSASFTYEGGVPRFDNAGTLLLPTGGATTFNGVVFNNYQNTLSLTGAVASLYMGAGGVETGTIAAPAGTTINFGAGVFNCSANSSITGAGVLIVSGGTANFAGAVNVTGTNSFTGGTANLTGNYICVSNTLLDISGGTANFDGTGSVAPNNLNLYGVLGGAQTVTVLNSMNWTGGTMQGSGQTIIGPQATLSIAAFTGYGGVFMFDRTLENRGAMIWGGGTFATTGVITNDAGASFQILGNAMFNYGGGSPRFDNAGSFLSSSTGTTAFNGVIVDNYGTINLNAGNVLYLNGGGANTGPITVPAGTTINFGAGVFNAGPGSSITGAGTLIVSGGTANLTGTVNVSATNSFTGGTANLTGNYTCVSNTLLDISGGTANFDGAGTVAPNNLNLNGILGGAQTVTVLNSMNWTGGTMQGSGQTIIGPHATLNIAAFTGYGGVYLYDRTLENRGTMVWGGGNFGTSGVVTNDAGASFQILGNAAFSYQGGSPRFDNAGSFLSSSTGTTAFNGVIVDNYGAINLNAGNILYLNGGGANTGPITVPAGTTINFGSGVFNASPGSSVTGAGTLQVSGGTANLAGTVNVTGTNSFSNGTANLTGNYTCVSNTLLDISGGTANFDGSGAVSPNRMNLFGVLGGANTVTVGSAMNWTGGTMQGSGRTVIGPHATLNLATFTGYSGVYLYGRTLENAGAVLWGGGNFGSSGVITNDPGATFQISGDAAFNFAGGSPRFDNAGTFNVTGVGGTTINPGIPLNNFGVIGIQASTLNASGGYSCSSNSALNFPLGGNVAGASYGQLRASGPVNLMGSLNVSLTNYYVPKTNDLFTLLTAGSFTGAFSSFTWPSNSVSLALNTTPTAEIVQVTGVSLKPTNALPAPAGLISWWRGENNAKDSVGPNNGAISNGVTYTSGMVGQSFLLDGTGGCVYVPDSPSLRPASVTAEAWVKIFSTNSIQLVFAKPLGTNTLDSYGLAIQNGASLAAICDTNGFGLFLYDPNQLTLGQWHHLAFTFDAASGFEALYTDGAMVASGNAGKSMQYDNHPLLLGADIENAVPSYFLNGQMDEASLYNRALTANEIQSIYNIGAIGKVFVPPSPPVLHLEMITPTTARIYWSASYPYFQLQYNTQLGATNWAASGLVPVITGTNYVVTNLLVGPQKYYRLSQQPAAYLPPPPKLGITLAPPAGVKLTWSALDDRPFVLQSSTNLSGGNWTPVSAPPVQAGWNYVLTNSIPGKQMFYRLSSP